MTSRCRRQCLHMHTHIRAINLVNAFAGASDLADSMALSLATACSRDQATGMQAQGRPAHSIPTSPGAPRRESAAGQTPKCMPAQQTPMRKVLSPGLPRLTIPSGFTESPQKRPRAPPSPSPPAGALQQLLLGLQAGSLLHAAAPDPMVTPQLEIAALDINLPAACQPLHMPPVIPPTPRLSSKPFPRL